jgi:hypothetical protein
VAADILATSVLVPQRVSGMAGNSVEAGNIVEIAGNNVAFKEMDASRDFLEHTDVDSWLGRSVVSDVTVGISRWRFN